MQLDPAPDWILDLCRAAQGKVRPAASTNPLVDLDTPSATARAIDYLKGPAPSAVMGDAGDIATYKVATVLREFGISQPAAVDLMLDHWNEAKALPPWPADELAQKVDNAYRYATGSWGGASALADFDAVEILEPAKKKKGLFFVGFDEAADTALAKLADPLIEGILDIGAMAIVYGASGSGKTFLMLDFALHIAAGRPWQGRDVCQGLVVYVAAEGGRGIFKRVAALKRHYKVDRNVPLVIVPCPVNLRDAKADVKALLALVKKAEAEYGKPARMAVIDTLSRALAGGDENTSTDMGAFVANVDHIRDTTKATVAIVHHSGKDTAKGARGWSGLRAATDTEIEIIDGVVRFSKQRDIEPAKDMKFTLDSVDIGADAKGRRVTSCVVRILTGTEFMKIELSGEAQEMFDAFVDQAKQQVMDRGSPLAEWENEPVALADWEKSYVEGRKERFGYVIENKGKGAVVPQALLNTPKPRHLRALRQSVVESGRIKKIADNQWVTA